MKRIYLHSFLIIFLFLGVIGCKKTVSFQSNGDLSDYMPMFVGKYITYRLDSFVYINFGSQDTTISYLAKDVVDDSITDNLGRPSWRVIRYLSDTTGTQPWVPIETYMVTPTRETIEVVENNLRFQKLKLPVVNGFSWKGNSYIDTRSFNTPYAFLDGWDYTYDSVGMTYTVLAGMIPNTVIVRQRDTTGDNAISGGVPIANPGPSQTVSLPVNSVQLDGSQSNDPDGFITAYSWSQVAGPAIATLADTSTPYPVMSNLQEGQYIFQLKVTDNSNTANIAQVKVIVAPAGNTLPVANAGANQTINLPVNAVTLDGSASIAPAGSIVSYSWSQSPVSGTITNPGSKTTDVTGLAEGNYTFTLTVTDNTGAQATDFMKVSVGPPGYSERMFSIEVYGKGIGLIYKDFLHSEYQPPNADVPVPSNSGYGIKLSMVDHN